MDPRWFMESVKHRQTGLAIHYPLIYSIVAGLETKVGFEFGMGYSTNVIYEALKLTGGKLYTISTDHRNRLIWHLGGDPDNIVYYQGESKALSKDYVTNLAERGEYLDFVLHDGAHDYETVSHDLAMILGYMKQYSILLVHDTLHSHCGKGVRKALEENLIGIEHSRVRLPFGFGLDIIRIEGNEQNGKIELKLHKPTSEFVTEIL